MTASAVHIPVLDTERLTLRGPTARDLAAYLSFDAVSDLTVGKYRGDKGKEATRAVLDHDIAHWCDHGYGMWLIEPKGGREVIGGVGIVHPQDWPQHELTWWLMPAHRGAGYAAEASRAVISWARNSLGWPRVETMMRDENEPARRLALRLGGTLIRRETLPDGVARDIFALGADA